MIFKKNRRELLMQLFGDDRIIEFICLTTEQEVQSKAGKVTVLIQASYGYAP